MNYYINLAPLDDDDEEDTDDFEITTLVMCGCKNHFIDSRHDPYEEHNKWVKAEGRKIEGGGSNLNNVRGIGVSEPKHKPTYDFSGDEFEVTNEELRKVRNGS
jgi:hypothetical protein